LVSCGLHFALPIPARADAQLVSAESSAQAEQRFQEALGLMKSDDCPRAIPEFTRSQELDPRAATLLNLATCYARLGRTGSAWRTYRQARDAATAEGRDDLGEKASRGIAVLTPKLTRLRIVVAPSPTAVSITVNEQYTAANGEPIPVDPGENLIEATAAGRQPWRGTVTGPEPGVTLVVEVPELLPLPFDSKLDHRASWRSAAIVVGGTALGALVVGSIFGLSAKSSADDMSSNCVDGKCNPAGMETRHDAVQKATYANYAFGLGALLGVTGIGLWAASSGHSDRGVSIAPWSPGPEPAVGLSVRGKM
jgi:hypothetical protein